ncbi:MAG: M61 family metallopeptidase, partial [Burkholderiales bacterium]|nr:M61 family metallopeptidase [Burkholderiales bacterium]
NGPVAIEKQDKRSWRIAACKGELVVRYTVYAYDLSVRGAYLDQTRRFFNGTSVCLGVEGQLDQPVSIDILPHDGKDYRDWRVATALRSIKAKAYGFGSYEAASYDELIDHPVELGDFTLIQFKACGVPHDFVLAGRLPKVDSKRLARDVKAICEHQIKMFGEPAPFDRYVFMTFVSGDGYGGLEHRASTALMAARDSLPQPGETAMKSSYRQYLGLISHEYFHSWNVKRIKPAAYAPYPADGEAYSRLLWAFEGLTSYYDDLTLVRAGLIDADSYLELLSQTATSVLRNPGHTVQSLADSSFDTWIKYYRQDENSPNSLVSYYTKGALVGLCLDLHIRQKTAGKKSLDDVMVALWERFGRDFYNGKPQGVPEREWEAVAEKATGLKLKPLFDSWLRSTEPLPLAEMLAIAGIRSQARTQLNAADKGGWVETPKGSSVWLGTRTAAEAGFVKVTHVLSDSPALKAGLAAGDLIVAVDGLKASQSNIDAATALAKPGDKLELLAFRRDELMRFKLKLEAAPPTTVGYKKDDSDTAKLAIRKAWLGA